MTITFLHSHHDSFSLEARYGSDQSIRLIGEQHTFESTLEFDRSAPASRIVEDVGADLVLVLTDPLAVAAPNLVRSLAGIIERNSDVVAVIPPTNLTGDETQRREIPASFLTIGQFERQYFEAGFRMARTTLAETDPGLFLARADTLKDAESPMSLALAGCKLAVAEDTYLFRYAPQQRMPRLDLLEMIPTEATSVLEIGCGEGVLGGRIRNRQNARVIGIEIDPEAARLARDRLDEVLALDAREAIREIEETFEWIVGGDVLEHLADPWGFLRDLRRLSAPGGRLLLSIPNVAAWPVVSEILRGRFDYAYAGHLSAGHLRFFTRKTIEDTIEMGGWELESIDPAPALTSDAGVELFERLERSGITHSRQDLETPGWYVLARSPSVA